MSTRESGRSNWLAAASLTVIAVAFLLLTAGPRARLHAQSSEPPQAPILVGDWILTDGEGCVFQDTWSTDSTPFCERMGQIKIRISLQQGRVFAGDFPDIPASKLTGAIAEDGRVSLHGEIQEDRLFGIGAVSISETTLEIRGVANLFEDWRHQDPKMGSLHFRLRKVR